MGDKRPGEFELIAKYLAPLATDPGSLALTDDAAIIPSWPGQDLVLTKDMLAAGIHFFPDDPPAAIAAKALRVNLSDLAAKGAEPKGYLLGLGLPGDWKESFLAEFCQGLKAEQDTFGITLYGGDTIRSPDGFFVSITAIGTLPQGTGVRRSGAKPGDAIFLTGTIGDAALGLKLRLKPEMAETLQLSDADRSHLQNRYLLPRPRVKAAIPVRNHANAAVDLSDGLAADLGHICEASGVSARIDIEKLPISKAIFSVITKDAAELGTCIAGGDDYEILACVPADRSEQFAAELKAAGVPARRIGEIAQGEAKVDFLQGGRVIDLAAISGFKHF